MDFERTATGPREWDLTSTAVVAVDTLGTCIPQGARPWGRTVVA
ncbi:hypothetical protein ACIQXD_01635 [Streptomyces uncialis]